MSGVAETSGENFSVGKRWFKVLILISYEKRNLYVHKMCKMKQNKSMKWKGYRKHIKCVFCFIKGKSYLTLSIHLYYGVSSSENKQQVGEKYWQHNI